MSWIIKRDDYERENKLGVKRKDQRVYQVKVKLPTQFKLKPCYCRNCGRKNSQTSKVCIQCEVELAPNGNYRRTPIK